MKSDAILFTSFRFHRALLLFHFRRDSTAVLPRSVFLLSLGQSSLFNHSLLPKSHEFGVRRAYKSPSFRPTFTNFDLLPTGYYANLRPITAIVLDCGHSAQVRSTKLRILLKERVGDNAWEITQKRDWTS